MNEFPPLDKATRGYFEMAYPKPTPDFVEAAVVTKLHPQPPLEAARRVKEATDLDPTS
jgi:hypothetical protein